MKKIRVRPSDEDVPKLIRLGCEWASNIKSLNETNPAAKRSADDAFSEDLNAEYAGETHAEMKRLEIVHKNLTARLHAETERRKQSELKMQEAEIKMQDLQRLMDDKDEEIERLKALVDEEEPVD